MRVIIINETQWQFKALEECEYKLGAQELAGGLIGVSL